MSQIIELFGTGTEAVLFLLIYRDIFGTDERKVKKIYKAITVIIQILLVAGLNHSMLSGYFIPIAGIAFWMIAGVCLFKTSYLESLALAGFLVMALGYLEENLTHFFAQIYEWSGTYVDFIYESGELREQRIVIYKILEITLYVIFRRFISRLKFNKKYAKFLIAIDTIGIALLILLSMYIRQAFPYEIVQYLMFATIIIFVGILIAYGVSQNKSEKEKNIMLEKQNDILRNNYESVERIYARNAQLYHDLNNHLTVLYSLAEKNSMKEVQDYIETISEPIKQLQQKRWTGEEIVDVIITSKWEQAQSFGCDMRVDAEFPWDMKINPIHICTILSNLLDNALEESEKHPENAGIWLTMRKIQEFYMIQVINSCEKMESVSGIPQTTKEDTEHHGWGLQNVQEVVEMYDGNANYECRDKKFISTITLFPELKSGKIQ